MIKGSVVHVSDMAHGPLVLNCNVISKGATTAMFILDFPFVSNFHETFCQQTIRHLNI